MTIFNVRIKSKTLYHNDNRRTCFRYSIRTSRDPAWYSTCTAIVAFARKDVRSFLYIHYLQNSQSKTTWIYFLPGKKKKKYIVKIEEEIEKKVVHKQKDKGSNKEIKQKENNKV